VTSTEPNAYSAAGADGTFKDLLEQRNVLERWYDYENAVTERALRAWCAENDLEVVNAPRSMAAGATESKDVGRGSAHP
jgi:hypothetical protein